MSTNEYTTPEHGAPHTEYTARVRPISPQGKLYGYADLSIGGDDGLTIFSLPIKLNNAGLLYTDMPGGYDKDGNWNELCKPHSSEAYKQINEVVLAQYAQEIENMRATLEAATQTQAPAQAAPAPELAANTPDAPAAPQNKPATERPAGKQSAQAKPASLSDNLKKKAAQAKAQQPATQVTGARGGGELGA